MGNSPLFSAGHPSSPSHTMQHWTKKQTNKKTVQFHQWEVHHCFLLVIILRHYIYCNTGLKKHSSISPSGKFTTVFCWSPFSTITFTATLDKAKQFNFTKWEIQHHFLLVTTVFHYIHCNTGQNKTTTTKSKQQKNLFNFTKWEIHHCFLLVIILNHYIQCNTGLKKEKKKGSVSPSGKFTTVFCWSPFSTITFTATLD